MPKPQTLSLLGRLINFIALAVAFFTATAVSVSESYGADDIALVVVSSTSSDKMETMLLDQLIQIRRAANLENSLRVFTMHFDNNSEAAYCRRYLAINESQLPCIALIRIIKGTNGPAPESPLLCIRGIEPRPESIREAVRGGFEKWATLTNNIWAISVAFPELSPARSNDAPRSIPHEGQIVFPDSWQVWRSPDNSYSLEVPSHPQKDQDESGLVIWTSTGDSAVYMWFAFDEPKISTMTPDQQAELAKFVVREFFIGAQVTPTSAKTLADGFEYSGTMGKDNRITSAQVRISQEQRRIFLLFTAGVADARRFFNSFRPTKTNRTSRCPLCPGAWVKST